MYDRVIGMAPTPPADGHSGELVNQGLREYHQDAAGAPAHIQPEK